MFGNRGTHWKTLYYSDREFYELCYWRTASVYGDEYDDPEDAPAEIEVVFGSRMSSLTLNLINREAIALFGWGFCGYLALAIHELTGLPLALFTRPPAEDEHGWRGHAAVQLPDGNFLDIEGVVSAEEINERYSFAEGIKPTFPTRDEYCAVMFTSEEHRKNPYGFLDELELRLLHHFAGLVNDLR